MNLVKEKADLFGVKGVDPEQVWFDLGTAMDRKDNIVQGIIDGIHNGLDRNKNISFITGRAEFTSPVDIRVDSKTITSEKTILAVGSKQKDPGIPGLEKTGYLTNNEALQLREIPESMIIIGGGYIGVEFAQMYNRFGTKVTILGRASRLMKNEEPELSETLEELLAKEGIDVFTSAEVFRVENSGGKRVAVTDVNGKTNKFEAAEILLAAGRVAKIDDLGLGFAGVEMAGDFIKVDGQLRTTSENVWSLGDANGGYMFTHRATYDGPIAAQNSVRKAGKKVDYSALPRAVFSEPALASVGMTETEAKKAGYETKTGKAYFKHSGRGKAIAQTEGLAKIVVDNQTNQILGGHILGPHADDLIHEIVIAMQKGGDLEPITKAIHIHPTVSEVIKDAAKDAR